MKKLMIALVMCTFALGQVGATSIQSDVLTVTHLNEKNKKSITVDQLPQAAKDKIAKKNMKVTEAFQYSDDEGNVTWYSVKGMVDGQEKTMKFDKNGEVKDRDKMKDKKKHKSDKM